MAGPGKQILVNGETVDVPIYSENVQHLLRSAKMPVAGVYFCLEEKLWKMLVGETKQWMASKQLDIKNSNDYKIVCGAICEEFIAINEADFRKRLSRSCANSRQYEKKRALGNNVRTNVQHPAIEQGSEVFTEESTAAPTILFQPRAESTRIEPLVSLLQFDLNHGSRSSNLTSEGSLWQYLLQTQKHCSRPTPKTIRKNEYPHCLQHLTAISGHDDPCVVQLFRSSYDHRTILIWNGLAVHMIVTLYTCLNHKHLIEEEILQQYSREQYKDMQENILGFLKAVQRLNLELNIEAALERFFLAINARNCFIKIFTSEQEFRTYRPLAIFMQLSLLRADGVLTEIMVQGIGLKIACDSLAQALLFIVLIFNFLEKEYPDRNSIEFAILESFVFGQCVTKLPDYVLPYLNQLDEMFAEISTMDSDFGEATDVPDLISL